MVQINFAQKEIQCKIVYYGPGMSGKTTNLELVHGKVAPDARGELTSIATTGERTLYFDYMPLDLGQIAGIRTKFQLYTVPGQIYYKSTRRLVLQGVDGIVFVADSSAAKLRENQESFADLEENLREMGKGLKDVPIVVQYNKRDLPDAMAIPDLEREVNPQGFPSFEAVANRGDGVFPTLKALAGIVLETVNKGGLAKTRAPRRTQVAAAAGADGAQSVSAVGTATATAPPPVAPSTAFPAAQEEAPPTSPARPLRPPSTTAPGGPPATPPPMPAQNVGAPPMQAPSTAQAPQPAPARAHHVGNFEDRMVKVSGLAGRERSARLPIILALIALIGGAILYAVSQF